MKHTNFWGELLLNTLIAFVVVASFLLLAEFVGGMV
jgi:hypothetical protein